MKHVIRNKFLIYVFALMSSLIKTKSLHISANEDIKLNK